MLIDDIQLCYLKLFVLEYYTINLVFIVFVLELNIN